MYHHIKKLMYTSRELEAPKGFAFKLRYDSALGAFTVAWLWSEIASSLREEIEQCVLSTTFFTAKRPKSLGWKGPKGFFPN